MAPKRPEAVRAVARLILGPLTRPHCLEVLQGIRDAGERGLSKEEVEARFDHDQLRQVEPMLRELVRVRAVKRTVDLEDARKRRYQPTIHTTRLLGVGESLTSWISRRPLAPGTALSTQAAKRPFGLATAIWADGIPTALHERALTVGGLALALDIKSTKVRHLVDRAADQGLLMKTPGPGGQKFISVTTFFSSLVPTVARATVYLSEAFQESTTCFEGFDLRVALAQVANATSLYGPLDATIGLRVTGTGADDVTLVVTFRDGLLASYSPVGDYSAEIESDLPGWLALLAGSDRSQITWHGRGARSLLSAIDALVHT